MKKIKFLKSNYKPPKRPALDGKIEEYNPFTYKRNLLFEKKIDKATISGDKNHHSLLLVKEVSTKSTNTDKSNNSNKSQMVSTGTNTASTDFLTNTISSRKRSRESSIQDDDEIIVSSENEFNSLTKSQNKIKFFFKNFITPSPGK